MAMILHGPEDISGNIAAGYCNISQNIYLLRMVQMVFLGKSGSI